MVVNATITRKGTSPIIVAVYKVSQWRVSLQKIDADANPAVAARNCPVRQLS